MEALHIRALRISTNCLEHQLFCHHKDSSKPGTYQGCCPPLHDPLRFLMSQSQCTIVCSISAGTSSSLMPHAGCSTCLTCNHPTLNFLFATVLPSCWRRCCTARLPQHPKWLRCFRRWNVECPATALCSPSLAILHHSPWLSTIINHDCGEWPLSDHYHQPFSTIFMSTYEYPSG